MLSTSLPLRSVLVGTWLSLAVGGCTGASPTGTAAMEMTQQVVCSAFVFQTFATADTEETKEQIFRHDAVFCALCPSVPPCPEFIDEQARLRAKEQ